MGRHKDYSRLMGKYNRVNWFRRLLKWILIIFAFLLFMYVILFVVR